MICGRHGIGLATTIVLVLVAAAQGGVKTETVEYWDGDALLAGYLAYDDSAQDKRPGVLVFHEWWGLNDYAKKRARQLAEMGYVALAADVYGKGQHTNGRQEAAGLSQRFMKDRKLLRSRAAAALKELKGHYRVDGDKVAAIGYSFGGTAALELARSGAKLRAVVSFYGGLSTPLPAERRKINCRVLVLHGADDPLVPASEVAAFQAEMRNAQADWQMNVYGGAVHSFANPEAGDDPSDGNAYSKQADTRSWDAMKLLLANTIGVPKDERGGIVRFATRKIARPIGKAGKAAGKAVKHGANWTWKKVTGKDGQDKGGEEPDQGDE